MLILTRKIGEDIIIGDDITITVLGVKGGQARIGINAPNNISIHRAEIYERIKRGLDALIKLSAQHEGIRNERHC